MAPCASAPSTLLDLLKDFPVDTEAANASRPEVPAAGEVTVEPGGDEADGDEEEVSAANAGVGSGAGAGVGMLAVEETEEEEEPDDLDLLLL